MYNELIFQLALELIPGIGSKGVKHLISYCGSASNVFKVPKSRLLKIPGVGEKMAGSIRVSRMFNEAEQILANSERIGTQVLHYTDPRFPKRLKNVHDAPNIIYVKGEGNLNPSKSIAIVGTRRATKYGRDVTDKIVSDLTSLEATIISGLAYGIDIQAHKAALKNRIPTFAVIAGGHDNLYPAVHKKYAEQMLETGGVISESIPGTKLDPHLFPVRNRIIAGMAEATIVVEAAEKGGALITAFIADSYNRAVFAVPGDVGNTHSVGTNRLIASQKALIYTGIQDLIYHLGWDPLEETEERAELPDLTEQEEILYSLLQSAQEGLEIDTISVRSEIPINQVASILLTLEFKNLVKSLPGKKFKLS